VTILPSKLSDYLYLPQRKFLLILIAAALLGATYLGYITPGLIAELYASYESHSNFEDVLWKLGLLFIFEYIVQVTYQVSLTRYVQHLLQHMRMHSFSNWLNAHESVGIGKHSDSKYPLGEVLARILSDTEAVIELVSSGSFKIFIDFTFIIACLISFIRLNTTSGIALIIVEVLACVLLILGSKKMGLVFLDVRKAMGKMSRVVADITAGFRFTFHTPNNHYAQKKSDGVFEEFLKHQLRANVWDASYFAIAESLFPIMLAILVIIFPYSHITEMAILAAIVDLIQRSIMPIKEVASKISSIQRAQTGIVRMREFNNDLSKLPTVNDLADKSKRSFKKIKVSVEHFEYPKQAANHGEDEQHHFSLDNIEFEACAGELVGIVGLSGCGKSTLLKILATDIVTNQAQIELFDMDDRQLIFKGDNLENLDHYKRQVSIVSQDSHVFSESLRFNITLSDEKTSDFDVFWARVSQEIPYLNQWGVSGESLIDIKKLSMGQKQLISALRSCFITKPIVLFDEISSGLDSDLEEALRKLVLLIQQKSLTIIVAHRLETIIGAHKILVLEKGRLVNSGTHVELMVMSAPYQEFINQVKSS
jgi:ABC-type multidrug transport system fused ATPase/permease subunit